MPHTVTDAAESRTSDKSKVVRFQFDAKPIDSIERMEAIAADVANGGKSFQVTKEVFDHFRNKLDIRPTSPEGIARINALIGSDFAPDVVMGMSETCACPSCGYELSFADHIESVLRMGLHSPEDLRWLLTNGLFFLTVATKQGREMICPNCDTKAVFPRRCYGTANYAYAHAGDVQMH